MSSNHLSFCAQRSAVAESPGEWRAPSRHRHAPPGETPASDFSGWKKEATVNLVVAHRLEAERLIAWFGLGEMLPRGEFPCFGDEEGLSLVVTGSGAERAAAGVRYLQERRPGCAWLNIGVAGHGNAAVGTGLLIHRIEDRSTGKRHWPSPTGLKLPGGNLITVSEAETGYAEDAAYDMEAAGFFAAASRLVAPDLVFVYKIVSDNPEHPLADFRRGRVSSLIGARKSEIHTLVGYLRERSARFARWRSLPAEYRELLGKYHFSATRKAALAKLCRRFLALDMERRLAVLASKRYHNAGALMAALEAELAGAMMSGEADSNEPAT